MAGARIRVLPSRRAILRLLFAQQVLAWPVVGALNTPAAVVEATRNLMK